jgi:lipopolysaccharide transport system permease protein
MGVIVTILLFLGPIVYPFSSVPDQIKSYVLWLNPLTIVVEQFRAVVLFGQMPDWQLLGIYSVFAVLMLLIGTWFFNRTQDGFADVI